MSLFKTKEWWRTECGSQESFDRQSLLVSPLFGTDTKDIIIVGSHSGYLRVFSPSSQWDEEAKAPTGYKTSDMIVEMKLEDCIIDIKTGRFVSGSQDLHLAVLMPTKLAIYSAALRKGSDEQGSTGDHCQLEEAYKHALKKFPLSLITGPFGGARGRDFICIQCLDGTLIFYEQEAQVFTQVLKNRLLPEPMIYVSRNDVFVTSSTAWILEFYRYQTLAEFGRSSSSKEREGTSETKKTLEPDWSYNIGEAILDIEAVTLSSFEVGVVVLGEKNLYCLKGSSAALKCIKRLEYKPLCFRPYVIEPDGKLMVLVIADTSTLMIYEGTTLKWSAQLPFAPVAVTRAYFQNLDGAIVTLSDNGQLEVSYLGSEPSLFIAPPVQRRGYDYVAAEREFLELRRMLKKSKTSGDQLTTAATDVELQMNVVVSPDLEPCSYNRTTDAIGDQQQDKGYSESKQSLMCRVNVELSSYTPLVDVQVSIHVSKPLVSSKIFENVSNLCERHVIQVLIYLKDDLLPYSNEVKVTASYETDKGCLRIVEKSAKTPLKFLLRPCPPENTNVFTAVVKCSEALLGFSQLFPEFASEHVQSKLSNALGVQHVESGRVVTIVSGSTSNRYRIQSTDGLAVTLVFQQLVNRLKERSSGTLLTSIGQQHVHLVQSQLDAHFHCRIHIDKIMTEINLLTAQLRNIERKLLRAIRSRNTQSLTARGLPFLLDATYSSILGLLDQLDQAKNEREKASHGLQNSLRFLLSLLRLNVSEEKYPILESAIDFGPQLRDQVDWEEVADVTLSVLLKSSKRSAHQDRKSLTWSKFTSTRDLAKLKKRLAHVVERLDTSREADIAENEP
ncbi:protein PTHB1 [Prorops nasuta]|uniref:protein PTHB1 n=1 Tax=Prorops nasuta TaxID=863751 RepID=UPI0034CDA246